MPRLTHPFHLARLLALAFALSFFGNLTAQTPPPEDIRGPKPTVEIPIPQKPPIALWTGIGSGVLCLALAAWFWKNRTRKQHLKSPPQVALAALAELEATRETLSADAFADRAAQTLRHYLAARFGLAAPRRTTEEFLRELTQQASSPIAAHSEPLKNFLTSCDLAKFAAASLTPTQRTTLLEAARTFISATTSHEN